jgi:hypothetical protein
MFIEESFITTVSSRLRNFKRVKSGLYNFSCNICGDSKKNTKKARGYFYTFKSSYLFRCHNCGASMSFDHWLQHLDADLHKEYRLQKFEEDNTRTKRVNSYKRVRTELKETPKPFKRSILSELSSLSQLDDTHHARVYAENRKLPLDNLYYISGFKKWVNTHKKQFNDTRYDDDRIIIPLCKEDGSVYGVQGRSLNKNSKNRYITVLFDEYPKIFGMDRIDRNKPIYVVEGPFDSLFVPNCLAMVGADVSPESLGITDYVMIWDNEPRSVQICNRMEKHINSDGKIVIWPSDITQKDINDMVLSGVDVVDIINTYTCKGLTAKLRFGKWRKC